MMIWILPAIAAMSLYSDGITKLASRDTSTKQGLLVRSYISLCEAVSRAAAFDRVGCPERKGLTFLASGGAMHPSHFAASRPDKPAIIMAGTGETVSYAQLNERAMRGAQMLRGFGLKTGDHLAFMLENRAAFHEIYWAAQRAGLYIRRSARG
jgi:hypothetical protein